MEITKFGALHYIVIGGNKYQIGPEANGGLMVRLVKVEGMSTALCVTASAGNTFHLRPDPQ